MLIKRKFLMLLIVALVIFATSTIVFAQSDFKTHEYNFSNKTFFNISDDLTNDSEFKLSSSDSLEVGTYYTYPDEKVICSLCFVGEDGVTDFEAHQQDSMYKKIKSNTTCQGYRTYIFNDSNEYDVFVDLDNMTVDNQGIEMQYCYFKGTFETLDEAQIFADTFKINKTENN